MLRLDKAEEEARSQVIAEENARLALWRMDSALTPIISQESVYPYFYFKPYYPASRAYSNMFHETSSDLMLPSPLKDKKSPYIRLHFQIDPDGALTSPEIPVVDSNLPLNGDSPQPGDENMMDNMERLKAIVDENVLASLLSSEDDRFIIRQGTEDKLRMEGEYPRRMVSQAQAQRPEAFDLNEWDNRAAISQQAIDFNNEILAMNFTLSLSGVSSGVMRPLWLEDNLFLARKVRVNGRDYLQGCWMDWDALKSWLQESISDLLPNADLKPALMGSKNGKEQMLATLPVKLVPGEVAIPEQAGLSPILFILIIAWICVLIAAGAAAGLLFGAMSLSERRAAFVSAVTHELRTPLTTLRMYAEMLSEGMIEDPQKKGNYLETIRTEADRLGHLVENVLTYARLERKRMNQNREDIPLRETLHRVKERLARRAAQSGMEIVFQEQDADHSPRVKVDILVIEQILFNLIDNSCKYAAAAQDKRIHIETGVMNEKAYIKVRDHGPGISPVKAGRLFRAFGKSAGDAANSAPGVGLGLALCKRLAAMMSGELYLDQSVTDGACFVLILPLHIAP